MSLPLWDNGFTPFLSSDTQKAEVTDASDWLWTVNPGDTFDAFDVPSIAPPYPSLWMESRFPEFVNIKGTLTPFPIQGPGAAAYFKYTELPNKQGWSVLQLLKLFFPDRNCLAAVRKVVLNPEGILSGPRPLQTVVTGSAINIMELASDRESAEAELQEFVGIWFTSFSMAVAFMHCKNITLEDAPGPPPRLAKKRAKLGRRPFVEHKILRIGQIREALHSSGAQTDIKMALHMCRGHFKNYTPERPLFGKHTGSFWHDAHLRGSKDVGEIHKSYQVTAPEGWCPPGYQSRNGAAD